MSPSSVPVPVQIGFDGHFVAASSHVKRDTGQTRCLTAGFSFPPFLEVLDLPDQFAVIGRGLELLQVLLVVVELSGVELEETGLTLQVFL